MNEELIRFLATLIFGIIQRHNPKTDGPLTNDWVLAELRKEIGTGKSTIAAWYAAKGLPIPE